MQAVQEATRGSLDDSNNTNPTNDTLVSVSRPLFSSIYVNSYVMMSFILKRILSSDYVCILSAEYVRDELVVS